MGKFNQNKDDYKAIDKAAERKSEWLDRCQAMGCCLKPSGAIAGHQLCTYHFMQEQGDQYSNWQSISDAIQKNKTLIKKMKSLYFKDSEYFKKPETALPLRGWDFCPWLENETINQYLAKFESKVREVIYQDAAEFRKHGNLNYHPSQKQVKKKPKGMKSIVEIAESLDAMRNKEQF